MSHILLDKYWLVRSEEARAAAKKVTSEIPASGRLGVYNTRPKPLYDVRPGEWYFGFDCVNCGQRFAVFDDPSQGTIRFNGARYIQVACSHCNYGPLYSEDEIRNFQAT